MNSKPEVPVFFATDDNYAPFLAVTFKSILDNASKVLCINNKFIF